MATELASNDFPHHNNPFTPGTVDFYAYEVQWFNEAEFDMEQIAE